MTVISPLTNYASPPSFIPRPIAVVGCAGERVAALLDSAAPPFAIVVREQKHGAPTVEAIASRRELFRGETWLGKCLRHAEEQAGRVEVGTVWVLARCLDRQGGVWGFSRRLWS